MAPVGEWSNRKARNSHGRNSASFLKNEATDLYENKGPGLGKNGNEATEGIPYEG